MFDRRHRTVAWRRTSALRRKTRRLHKSKSNAEFFPFGGATLRFPERAGWGNAMRWLLTGDEFDAKEALRIGLVQEIRRNGKQVLDKAVEIAERIAKQAPLGVCATIRSARKLQQEGFEAAKEYLTTADFSFSIRRCKRRRPVFSRTARRKFHR